MHQHNACVLQARAHQGYRHAGVSRRAAALRNGAYADHAQLVECCLRHHNGRSSPLLLMAQRGVKVRHHDVAALPGGVPHHSATSCPDAGIVSQPLSIISGLRPCMASKSSRLYLRRLTGDKISRPASNSKLTLSPGCSPVLLASVCGMVTAMEPPAALSVDVCMVLPLVCST